MSAAWKSWPLPDGDVDMYAWQAGRCAICGIENDRFHSRTMARDHCHETGLVRGYLCSPCNTGEASDDWDEWRNGDHVAQALGHFEVYQNQFRATPLSPTSALSWFTRDEQFAWWAEVETSVKAGGRLPSEAPWTDEAKSRRDLMYADAKAQIDTLFLRPTEAS